MRGGQVDRVEAIAARRPPSDMVTAIPGGGADFALADHLQRADVLVGRRKAGGLLAGLPGVAWFGARRRLAVRPLLLGVEFSACFAIAAAETTSNAKDSPIVRRIIIRTRLHLVDTIASAR